MDEQVTKTSAIVSALVALGLSALIITTPSNWPECPTEDSTWCSWDASAQGNGQGSTVINFWGDFYITL